MSTTLKGVITVFKRDGSVAWSGQASNTRQIVGNLTSTDEFNPQKLIIGGKVLTLSADERTERVTIRCTPAAGTGTGNNTLANAEAACERPDPLAAVTLAGWPDDIDGDYHYMGGDLNFPDGVVEHTMNLERYNGAVLPAADA